MKKHRPESDPLRDEAVKISKATGRKRRDVERELRCIKHQRFMRHFSYVLALILIFYVASLVAAVSQAG